MELKKGIYFTIDSIIAASIILIFIALVSSFYVKHPSIEHLSFLSQDLINVFSTIKVKELNNPYLNSLISDGTITNTDNTILQQVGEFWAKNQMDLANRAVSNVTEPWVPSTLGFGVWIGNEPIYERNVNLTNSLVSSKKIMTGIIKGKPGSSKTRKDPPTLLGHAIFEVRVWE